jgi:hypothetical protein
MRAVKETEPSVDGFDRALIRVIGNEHPETLEKAVELARLKFSTSEKVVMNRVLCLESQGKILFEKPPATVPSSLKDYFFSSWVAWFWVVFFLAVATTVMVFLVPEDVFPLVYARYVFGSVFVLFLPGFSLIKALFSTKELDNVERLALSIGLSLALVPMAGLLLNYTPFGIRTAPVTVCLLVLTLVFASAAVIRDYGVRRKMVDV